MEKTKTIKKTSQPIVSNQIVCYRQKNVKISPRKLRLLANLVKKLTPNSALDHLTITNSKSARLLYKAIKNAIADATTNHHLDQNNLKFSSILVNESVKFKRMDKSHSSRFSRGLIQKRHSYLTINILGPKLN